MLCAMYLAQGIPWGFMTIALIAYLASLDVSTTEAGGLMAVVLLPGTFKLIWAPLVDSITIRSMGRRRPWIIAAELMMAISLLGLLALGDLSQNLKFLRSMFFIHNCFASMQDVATDALAVDVLPPTEQGRVNGLMWGSKLIGKAIGASAMAIAISQWGIQAAIWLQFFMLLVIMLFPLLLVERPGDRRLPWTKPVWGGRSDKDGYQATGDDHSDRSSATMTVITSSPSATDTESRILNLRSPKAVIKDLVRTFSLVTT
jgi:PAT family beta-lactamase induction signal transducer AmpG